MSDIAMELNSHQRGEYGKPCAAKVARTVWSRGKAQALPIATRTFKKVDYAQALDLTVRLGDCLPPEHLARFVVDSVALLDVSSLYAHYGSRGGEPYAPEVLLGLLFYGYATGVFSSRKIERATYEAVPFRFIAGNQHPDHDTLATFRRTFLPELKDLFVQVLLLAQEAGVLKLGTISLDGTKLHADASKHNAVSYKRLLEVETQLRTERPARHPRWASGARGDGAARGPPGTAGGGQSGAGSACHRARGCRAGGV